MPRILLLADVHGNLPALDAVLADAVGTFDLILSAGDQVGLGPWPAEVLERLAELGCLCVLGNHDEACLSERAIQLDPQGIALVWTRETLPRESLEALASFPERRDGEGWTLVHGSPRGPLWEFLVDRPTALGSFERFSGLLGLYGHTHRPGGFVLDGDALDPLDPGAGEVPLRPGARYLLNPGSVGAPRDGDPRAAYAVADRKRGRIEFHRVAYPVERTVEEIGRVGLPASLGDRLRQGR